MYSHSASLHLDVFFLRAPAIIPGTFMTKCREQFVMSKPESRPGRVNH